MNHRISIVTGLVVAGTVLGTAPAAARTPCTDTQVRCPATSVSPYAAPIDALDGRTLAQYLADHQAGDRRLARS